MQPIMRRTFSIFAPGVSLRRRVALSLAIVRLILAPVILVAVYYLFEMGWIVDRIVSVDAPAATLAQQASIQMLEARRAERNFFLLYDAADVKENHDSLKAVTGILTQIRNLQPEEQTTIQNALNAVNLYQQRFAAAVSYLSQPGEAPRDRIEAVVRNYERDLNVWCGGIAARAGPSSSMSFAHKWTRSILRSCPPFRLATRSCGKLPAIWIHRAMRSSA